MRWIRLIALKVGSSHVDLNALGGELSELMDPVTQIIWLNADTCVEVQVNDHDQARVEFGPAPYGVVLVADRYQLHRLIIEIDRQLSRHAQRE